MYDAALRDRGDLTDAGGAGGVASAPDRPRRAVVTLFRRRDRNRSDDASRVRPAVATGLLRSVARLQNLDIGIPHHTTLSRRSAAGALATDLATVTGLVHVVIDSTGLKVYGASEWHLEKHGGHDQRTWRKLHLAVDPDSGAILACELTDKDEGDPTQVEPLLNQVTGDIASVTAPTTVSRYTGPSPSGRPEPTSSSRHAPPPNPAPTQRDRHIHTIAQRGRLG
jgi:Transposase DDE domain